MKLALFVGNSRMKYMLRKFFEFNIFEFKTSVLHLGDQRFNFNDHAENFCFTFSVANMVENETQRELQTMI